jgi:predicted negative regulator of RcsB-dependent stress response
MKRTERHHLKEDEMAHGVHWLTEFFQSYQREITYVAGAVVLALVVLGGLLAIRAQSRSAQSVALGKVIALAAEVAQKPEKLADLEKLAAGGRTARPARVELARYWAEKSDWAKADATLAKLPAGPKDLLYYQAEDLRAQVAVGRKDFDMAIAIYKKIGEDKPKAYPLDAAAFRLAECHELKGDAATAVELYKKVQVEFPQSYFGYEASLKLSKLEARK